MKHVMQGQGRTPGNFRLDASLNVFFSPKKDLSEVGSTTCHPLCGQAQKGDVTYQGGTQPANLQGEGSRPWVLSPSKRWATATKRHCVLTLVIKCSSSSSRLLRCAGTATERDLGKDLAIKNKDLGKCTFLEINLWIHCENMRQSRQNPLANTLHH